MGVDLAAILIAGVGLAWLRRVVAALAVRFASRAGASPARARREPALSLLFCIVVLEPAWVERARYDHRGAALIRQQRLADDATDGARPRQARRDRQEARRRSRRTPGCAANWGADYKVWRGACPRVAHRSRRRLDRLRRSGRSHRSRPTSRRTSTRRTRRSIEMFNVRYLILPADRQPACPRGCSRGSGRHRLYEVQTTGYLQVVDRAPAVAANRNEPGAGDAGLQAVGPRLARHLPGRRLRRRGGAAARRSPDRAPPAGPSGRVLSQTRDARERRLHRHGRSRTARPSSCSSRPTTARWTATVDGLPVKPVMMAPSLVGVAGSAGPARRQVRVRAVRPLPAAARGRRAHAARARAVSAARARRTPSDGAPEHPARSTPRAARLSEFRQPRSAMPAPTSRRTRYGG